MKRSTRRVIKNYALTLSIAISIAMLLRIFIIETFLIRSTSMKPTLVSGDTIFVLKWPFLFKNPILNRGDIIIYSNSDSLNAYSASIKRIIGMPGDFVAIKNGSVILNGKQLAERQTLTSPYTTEFIPNGPQYQIRKAPPLLEDFGPAQVPEGNVFCSGDWRSQLNGENRITAGFIPSHSIIGRALWIWGSIQPKFRRIQ